MTGMHGWVQGVLWLVLGGIVATLASCANPMSPRGGPRDETPPFIVNMRPQKDTVNVATDTRSVYIEFSEYIERNTLTQSLSVTPQFDQRLRFDWDGQGVEIELPSSLRDSTTYLFSFDTNLSDAHGVSLDAPITVAFSTGPRINKGEIRGRVVRPAEGTPQQRVAVFAYALPTSAAAPPDSLPERPAYRTQTSEDGTFSFNYLREQPYFVVAVQDNNRNRRPDPTEAYAVPPRPAIAADTTDAAVPVPWLLTKADTLRPRFRRAQPLSRQRLRLSFSEPIQLSTRRPSAWPLRDSIADAPVAVQAVYQSADRVNAVILRTAPMDSTRHVLPLADSLVTDTLGQALLPDTARFQAVPRSDTTQTRFQAFVPENRTPDSTGTFPLLPGDRPGVRFNQAPDSSTLRRVLTLQDTTQSRTPTWTTDDGRTYRLQSDSLLPPDSLVAVTVNVGEIAGPDTTYQRRFRRVTDRVLGALEGRAVFSQVSRRDSVVGPTRPGRPTPPPGGAQRPPRLPPDTVAAPSARDSVGRDTAVAQGTVSRGPIVVEIIPTESQIALDPRRQTIEPGSTFVFRELPEGTFRFRAFRDRNENGRWDGGFITPYTPAETVTWSEETTNSRPRWTNVISAPLRLPILAPADASTSAPPGASMPAPAPDTTAADSLNR